LHLQDNITIAGTIGVSKEHAWSKKKDCESKGELADAMSQASGFDDAWHSLWMLLSRLNVFLIRLASCNHFMIAWLLTLALYFIALHIASHIARAHSARPPPCVESCCGAGTKAGNTQIELSRSRLGHLGGGGGRFKTAHLVSVSLNTH